LKLVKPLYAHSFLDYPDPSESCITINTVGCEHKCFNCSNPVLQNPDYEGTEDNKAIVFEAKYVHHLTANIKTNLPRYNTNNVSIVGGDPLHPNNIQAVKKLLEQLKLLNINTIVYTGYCIDYCKENNIKDFTFLKTGRYIDSLKMMSEKTDEYFQLASANQELYGSEYKLLSYNGRYWFI